MPAEALTPRPARSPLRRLTRLLHWLLPAAGLALVPKCPACLAACVALGTGFSLSLTTAEHLRLTVLGLSLAALTFLVVRTLRRSPCRGAGDISKIPHR